MNNEGIIMLSILIPTFKERWEKLNQLMDILQPQIDYVKQFKMLGEVEVMCRSGESFINGGESIGKKREALVGLANGKYLDFLDDDETPAPNYIESLLRACQHDADIVTFQAIANMKDYWALVDMRLSYRVNDQLTPEHTVRRPPWHICPVRSEFAKLYQFQDLNNAEDFQWMEKVLTHCTTETHTDKILFRYNHGDHSEADKITQHEKLLTE